jgi:hypothetical protein
MPNNSLHPDGILSVVLFKYLDLVKRLGIAVKGSSNK